MGLINVPLSSSLLVATWDVGCSKFPLSFSKGKSEVLSHPQPHLQQ